MNNSTLIQYLLWADGKLIELLEEEGENYPNNLEVDQLSLLNLKLKHLVEEYITWRYDLLDENWQEAIRLLQEVDISALLIEMRNQHQLWKEFIQTNNVMAFEIDEGEFTVDIELDEVIFNLVNHSSYHRGQIIAILRQVDIETPITDYYWFKIDNRNLSTDSP